MRLLNERWMLGGGQRRHRYKAYNKGFCAGDKECERRREQLRQGKLNFSASKKSRHYREPPNAPPR